MASAQGRSTGQRLRQAVLHPVAIGSAVAAAIAVAFGLPLLAVAFGVVWLGTVAVKISHGPSAPRAPETSHLPPSLQRDLLGVTTALDQLRDAARAVPAEQKPMFEGIEREAEEVRSSVLELAQKAGALHRHLEATRPDGEQPPGDAERRERMLSRLQQYRETLQSLETTARELADRAVELAAGGPMRYDALDERSPERRISEMKASMAAIEEVVRTETEML